MCMNVKWILLAVGVLVLLVGGFFAFNSYIYNEKQADTADDYKNATYIIDGEPVTLIGGVAETEAVPGSASKITTHYFGNELIADLNNDGREDVVFILMQETGGSGTFYYTVAALNTGDGYIGSQAYLLGDRIAPQTTELSQNPNHQNVIVVNYVDRAPSDPMSAQPSVGKSVWLKLDPQTMQFGVVEQDFEGEVDSSRMSLTMKEWMWSSALYNDGRSIEPDQPNAFILTFTEDGRFSATTDCNYISGSYIADEYSISFERIAMDERFCPESQETEFLALLENAQLYHFTARGELILDLKFDSGTATFR